MERFITPLPPTFCGLGCSLEMADRSSEHRRHSTLISTTTSVAQPKHNFESGEELSGRRDQGPGEPHYALRRHYARDPTNIRPPHKALA
jgi:hypothetical protein